MAKSSFTTILAALIMLALLTGCGEDRAGEQPFPPLVQTLGYTMGDDSCQLRGLVNDIRNSNIVRCGFDLCIGDTIWQNIEAPLSQSEFSVWIDSLQSGEYAFAAYATNGIGTTHGDTMRFFVR